MVAAAVSLIIGILQDVNHGWLEGSVILIAIVIVVLVSAVNDYMKERQFQRLNSETSTTFLQAYRSGKEIQLSTHELLVGDIILFSCGDLVPVDGLIIRSFGVSTDESPITGESDTVSKNSEEHPFLISGSIITEGSGTMLVCAVGRYSNTGKSREMMQFEEDPTPL